MCPHRSCCARGGSGWVFLPQPSTPAAALTADFLLSLAQAIAKGLLTGMVYGLMALGLSVIFGVMRVVNFAHGEMMVVGMYLAWAAFDYADLTPLLCLTLIAPVFFALGYCLQRA